MTSIKLENRDWIKTYLSKFNFDETEMDIFIFLLKNGPMTVLKVSKKLKIERTKTYRILENAEKKGLVEKLVANKTTIYKAVDTEKFDLLIKNLELETKNLRESFSKFEDSVLKIKDIEKFPETSVKYFRGVDGVKQVLWNSLRAKTELLSYVYRVLNEVVGDSFFSSWYNEFLSRKLFTREIRSENYKKSKLDNPNVHKFYYPSEIKFLPEKLGFLRHQMDIYNDTVAIYYWSEEEIFAVEIKSKIVADMQRDFFEVMWNLSEKY